MAKSTYKPWKNYQEKPSSQGTKQQVQESAREIKRESTEIVIPNESVKVVKLEKGSSALVTHSKSKKEA